MNTIEQPTTLRRVVRRHTKRKTMPRLLAYSPRRMVETCGCSELYPSSCEVTHHNVTGPGCGEGYPSVCGLSYNYS